MPSNFYFRSVFLILLPPPFPPPNFHPIFLSLLLLLLFHLFIHSQPFPSNFHIHSVFFYIIFFIPFSLCYSFLTFSFFFLTLATIPSSIYACSVLYVIPFTPFPLSAFILFLLYYSDTFCLALPTVATISSSFYFLFRLLYVISFTLFLLPTFRPISLVLFLPQIFLPLSFSLPFPPIFTFALLSLCYSLYIISTSYFHPIFLILFILHHFPHSFQMVLLFITSSPVSVHMDWNKDNHDSFMFHLFSKSIIVTRFMFLLFTGNTFYL